MDEQEDTLNLAGTAEFLVELNGKRFLADFKTGPAEDANGQLAAYSAHGKTAAT